MIEQRSPSISEIKKSIKQLEMYAAEAREQRVAAGLPGEVPECFVNPHHAERIKLRLNPLQEGLTDYLDLTNKAKRIIPIPSDSFDSQIRDITLLIWSPVFLQSLYGRLLLRCIEVVQEAQSGNIAYERVVSLLLANLSLADSFKTMEYDVDDYIEEIKPYESNNFDEILEDYWSHYVKEIAPRKEKEYELLGWTFEG